MVSGHQWFSCPGTAGVNGGSANSQLHSPQNSEAAVTGADPQHLCAVFNITPDTGLRYTRILHPDPLPGRDQEDTP